MEGGALLDLIAQVRAGHSAAGDALCRHLEPWLRLIAQQQMESRLQAKFDPSDLVQQTMIEVARDLGKFRGGTEGEFLAWVRQVLVHALAHEIRRYRGTQKRDVNREVSLDQSLSAVSQRLGDLLPASATSPTGQAVRHERELVLARALERLPDDYRTVLVLRHLEGLAHEEVARRMGRQSGAVRMLWVRALAKLRTAMAAESASRVL